MSLHQQPYLPWVQDELVIDCFAGGGGASSGIEQAFGRPVDLAINHDPAAIALHEANHPSTKHLVSDVWEVDPREATAGRNVGFAWFSPDCQHFSKARGGKPIRTTRRRSLAHVVIRWAGTVRPRVIMLENVEEFEDWGPLVGPPENLKPCKKRKGRTFKKWVGHLRKLGYEVEWRQLRACDFGAPTIRKRLYLIARCDGQPIIWPEPSFGPKREFPYRTAAECIDWTIPMLSIFATKEEAGEWAKEHNEAHQFDGEFQKMGAPIRPLADNTMRRIARGIKRFVLDNPKPFLVNLAHGAQSPSGKKRWGDFERDMGKPMTALACSNDTSVVAPYLVPRYGEREGQEPRVRSVEDPAPVIVPDGNGGSLVAAHLHTANNSRDPLYGADEPTNTIVADGARHSVVSANLVSYHDEGNAEARASRPDKPIGTLDCSNRHGLVTTFLGQHNGGFAEGNSADGHAIDDPSSTISTKGPHQSLISGFLAQNNGGFYEGDGHDLRGPNGSICAEGSKQSLVAAHIQRDFGTSTGHKADQPLGCITTEGGGKAGLVASFLSKFYGQGVGQENSEPLDTITAKDRFGLVTVKIGEQTYVLEDIAMRMLQPKELYLCQGFRPGYVIDRGIDGRKFTKTEQVRMVGNSVSPPVAEALAKANCPELVVKSGRQAA